MDIKGERKEEQFLLFLRIQWKTISLYHSFSLLTSSNLWRCCGMAQVKRMLLRLWCSSSSSSCFSMLILLIVLLLCFVQVSCSVAVTSYRCFVVFFFFMESSRKTQLTTTEEHKRKKHEAQPVFSSGYHTIMYASLPSSTV